MKQPTIVVTVSWIKNVYLRRIAMIASLPFVALIAVGQGALLAVLVIAIEPFRRAVEVVAVLCEMVPSFKEQWKATAAQPAGGADHD